MPKGRISGGSEDFGASGLPKKLRILGNSPGDVSNFAGVPKKNTVFKKTRIYQLGTDVISDEKVSDEPTDNTANQ